MGRASSRKAAKTAKENKSGDGDGQEKPEGAVPTVAARTAAALQADPGPLIVTLALNRVTGVLGMAGNAASEHDWELARDALALVSADVQGRLIALAEARGKSMAAKAAGAGGG